MSYASFKFSEILRNWPYGPWLFKTNIDKRIFCLPLVNRSKYSLKIHSQKSFFLRPYLYGKNNPLIVVVVRVHQVDGLWGLEEIWNISWLKFVACPLYHTDLDTCFL